MPPSMRRLILSLLLLACCAAASAADSRKFAVLSLIGDKLELVYAAGVTGQPVDRIERRHVPLDDSAIDRAALLAVNDQLQRLQPGNEPVLLQAFERSYFDVSGGTGAIVEWVRNLTRDKKATHVILISKLAYEGIPALQKPFVGSGTLEGVGFFVGRTPPPTGMDPNSAGPGFLSPFAYFRVSLIDLKTGQVVKEERGLASNALSATETNSGNPWEALDSHQKMKALQDMVRTELAHIIPRLVAN